MAIQHENVYRDSKALDDSDMVVIANNSHVGKTSWKSVDLENLPALKKLNLDPEASYYRGSGRSA